MTSLTDNALMLQREIWRWSLLQRKGLRANLSGDERLFSSFLEFWLEVGRLLRTRWHFSCFVLDYGPLEFRGSCSNRPVHQRKEMQRKFSSIDSHRDEERLGALSRGRWNRGQRPVPGTWVPFLWNFRCLLWRLYGGIVDGVRHPQAVPHARKDLT